MRTAYVVAGPERHGVVLHGLGLAQASAGLAASLVRMPAPALDGAPDGEALRELVVGATGRDGVDRLMLQVTDRLFGATPESAADLVSALGRSTSLVLCLHDLPHPAEGEQRCRRRQRAYARMASAADAVVVASEHERRLLEQCFSATDGSHDAAVSSPASASLGASETSRAGPDVVVIPLPLERLPAAGASLPASRSAQASHCSPVPAELGVLGFLYPGKGVEQVIEAASALTHRFGPLSVTNYGAVADGHREFAAQLQALARRRGVRLTVTGFLPADEMVTALRRTTVPVAAHRHISASGSIGTWLSAGRRPVVRAGGWTTELASRVPGALTLTDDLTEAVAVALTDPASTWLGEVPIGPGWAEAAQRHLDLLGRGP